MQTPAFANFADSLPLYCGDMHAPPAAPDLGAPLMRNRSDVARTSDCGGAEDGKSDIHCLAHRLDAWMERQELLVEGMAIRQEQVAQAILQHPVRKTEVDASGRESVGDAGRRVSSGVKLSRKSMSGAFSSAFANFNDEDKKAREEAMVVGRCINSFMDTEDVSAHVGCPRPDSSGKSTKSMPSLLRQRTLLVRRRTLQSRMQAIVGNFYFELFFSVAIISNSVIIGVEAESMALRHAVQSTSPFAEIHHMYTFIFLVELLARFSAERMGFFCSKKWMWNLLDSTIVVSSMLEVLIELSMRADVDGQRGDTHGAAGDVYNMRILRLIRITRLIRVFRITRLMRFVRALRTLVSSIFGTLKSLVWAMALLFMIIYVFGIVFTQAVTEHFYLKSQAGEAVSRDIVASNSVDGSLLYHWGSLASSMFTLFKSISGGLSWDTAAWSLQEVDLGWAMIFVCFIAFSSFAVLNVVTGVFCQSAMDSAAKDQENAVQSQLANKSHFVDSISQLFEDLGGGEGNELTFDIFEQHLKDDRMQAVFQSMDIDVDDAWTLFKLLDTDETRAVDPDEFVTGCLRLRGPAKSIHLAQLMLEQQRGWSQMHEFMQFVESQFRILKRDELSQTEVLLDLAARAPSGKRSSSIEI